MKIGKVSAQQSIKTVVTQLTNVTSLPISIILLCGVASFSHVALGAAEHYVFSAEDAASEFWVRAVQIDEDPDLDRYRYSLLPDRIRGTLVKTLSSGRAIIAENTDQNLIGKYAFVENGEFKAQTIPGVFPFSEKTIHVREGDHGTFHLGWLDKDGKSLHYAHIDPSTHPWGISVAQFRFQRELQRPPRFYLSPHVLVGRGHVAILRKAFNNRNPVTVLNIFRVRSKKGLMANQLQDLANLTTNRRGENPEQGNFAIGNQGLIRTSVEIEVGTPLQPNGVHAWYGSNYVSLSHHLNSTGDALVPTRVAVSMSDSGDIASISPYKEEISRDIWVLSNLAEPLNSYRAGMGRGGLAWLEVHAGHKVYINIFRDGSVVSAVPLTSQIAGALSVKDLGSESLFWLDQGEEYLPVAFLMTGDKLLYQVDLEDPENFTLLPSQQQLSRIAIWPPIEHDDERNVAFVASLTDRGGLLSIHRVYRRWKGANLEYFWKELDEY